MRTSTARYADAEPAYVAVNVQVLDVLFGSRPDTGQLAMALSVSVTVPAANELRPPVAAAVERASVALVATRQSAVTEARKPAAVSSRLPLSLFAPWRMRCTSLS